MIKGILKKYREVISYLFWGIMTTVVSWVTYGIFVSVININNTNIAMVSLPLNVLIANIFSWVCAIVFAFTTNKFWVFCSKSGKVSVFVPELVRFVSARAVTGILEIIAVPLLVGIGMNQNIIGIEGALAKVIVSVVVIILNYIFSKMFVFNVDKKNI